MNQKMKFVALSIVMLFVMGLCAPATAAAKMFIKSDDAKEKDEPQEFLQDYDKLVKGAEADWVYFAEGFKASAYKTVGIKPFHLTGKGPQVKIAAESGPDYYDTWITKSKLGWKIVKEGGDLILEGNIANAWAPNGAARFWGGWMANPGACQELIGKDSKGNIVFQIRHKSRGSTVPDAIENGIENIIKTLEKGK